MSFNIESNSFASGLTLPRDRFISPFRTIDAYLLKRVLKASRAPLLFMRFPLACERFMPRERNNAEQIAARAALRLILSSGVMVGMSVLLIDTWFHCGRQLRRLHASIVAMLGNEGKSFFFDPAAY